MLVDRKPDQGIEDSQPVEVSLGVVVAGSAEHYLFQAIKDSGFQMTSRPNDANGTLEFLVGVKDVLEVVTLVATTKESPKFELLTRVLDGQSVTIIESQKVFGDVDGKLSAEMNLVAAVRNYEKRQTSGSVIERANAKKDYLDRRDFASMAYGISGVDAQNHLIRLVEEEYQAVRLKVQETLFSGASKE